MLSIFKNHKKLLLTVVLLIVICISLLGFLKSNKTKIKTIIPRAPSINSPSTHVTSPNKSTNSSSTTTSTQSTTISKNSPQNESNTNPPILPSGNFVSNYNPDLNGSPSPNLIGSTCITTPGATCTISFSMNGTTKSLPSEVTNANGVSYWTWHLQDIGLTVGSWSITATATLNGKTTTSGDTLKLNIQP